MTVIAWDGQTLAADKQSTQYSQKQTVSKIFKLDDGSLVAICGQAIYGLQIIEWIKNGGDYPNNKAANEESYAAVLHIKDGKLYKYEQLPTPLLIEQTLFAMGSGQDYAIAAMHCGKSAKEAVEITSIYSSDCGCGMDVLYL